MTRQPIIPLRNAVCGAAIALALAACSVAPASGPRTTDIQQGAATAAPFTLIDLNPVVTRTISDFVGLQRDTGPVRLPQGKPLGLVGPSDLLKIAIWEPNPAGTSLASDKSGIETTTRVGIDGTIGIPYVGRVVAAGRTPAQIEREVAARLAHISPGAQVVALVLEDNTNDVIVQGEVAKPGRYPVVPNSSGLLDVLAMAGGAHIPDHQALVRVTRGGVAVTRTLTQLVDTRALELDLSPGDRILVQPRLSYFYAFGAVNRPGEQAYDADDISLAHTLARIQGLADTRADPAAVFVYRRQAADLTRQLVIGGTFGPDPERVIYRLNLRDPGGFFISQGFPVLPGDIVYVSESPIAEAAKVFQIINGVSAVGAIPRNLGAPY